MKKYLKKLKKLKKIKSLKNYGMEPLSPKVIEKENRGSIEVYLDRLKAGISTKNISNIALMGEYGSGKSTILNTLSEELNNKHEILKLSLASFSDNKLNVEGEEVELENLESSLLKQMIYKPKTSEIPFSRFKRISIKRWCHYLRDTILIMLPFLFYYLYSYHSAKWNMYVRNSLIAGIVIIIGWMIFNIIRLTTTNYKIKKLGIKSLSIETSDEEYSFFSKYLEEILYLFETAGYDLVIIEDVDRFENIQLFEHLRELNFIINNSESINRKVTFIYAVNDAIFKEGSTNEEHKLRTKFFDLIVPVVPIMNSYNSKDFLLEKVQAIKDIIGNEMKISNQESYYYNSISHYIDDMRLLNNTINEFSTYMEILKSSPFSNDDTKLFSILLFKNLYPSKFSSLQNNEGFLHELLQKRSYKIDLKKQLDNILNDKQSEKSVLSENLEIRKVENLKYYLFQQDVPKEATYSIGDTSGKVSEISNEFFDILATKKGVVRFRTYSFNKQIAVEKILSLDVSGLHLIDESEERINDKILCLDKNIADKKNTIQEINILNFKDLYYKFSKFFEEKIQEEYEEQTDLMMFLLTNGFISEDYQGYISLFYGKQLSYNDTEYLNTLRSNALPTTDSVTYKFDNIENIINELTEVDYTRRGILNVFLYEKHKGNKVITMQILNELLNTEEDGLISFIDHSIIENDDVFFKDLLDYLLNTKSLAKLSSRIVKNKLFEKFILYADETELGKLYSENNSFAEYVTNGVFIDNVDREIFSKKVKPLLIDNKTKIKDISIAKNNHEIYEEIIKYQLFYFSIENLQNIIFYIINDNTISYANILNISHLKDAKLDSETREALLKYVNNQITIFVEKILLINSEEELQETEDSFIKLFNEYHESYSEIQPHLNDEDLDNYISSISGELVNKLNVYIPNIKEIKSAYEWKWFFKYKKIAITWDNIISFYNSSNRNNQVFVSYFELEEVIDALLDKDNENKEIKSILDFLLSENITLKDANIRLFSGYKFKGLDLNDNNLKMLLENNLIEYSEDFINKYITSDNMLMFINNYSSYFKGELNESINRNVLLQLSLSNQELSKEAVDTLFSRFSISDLIENNELNELFLSNIAIPVTNMGSITTETYDDLEEEMLSDLAKNLINYLIINDRLFNKKFDDNVLMKLTLFINKHFEIQQEDLSVIVSLFNKPYNQLFIGNKKQVKIPINRLSQSFLVILENNDIVSSYSKDLNENYTVYLKHK